MLQKILAALIEHRLLNATFKKISKICKKIRLKVDQALSLPAIFILSRVIPIDNEKIMFLTFRGEYDCNAKYIAEEIKNRGLPYNVVWTIRKKVPVGDVPETFIKTYRGSLDFFKHLASAHIIVDNGITTANVGYIKKKRQILIETWHGSIGIKAFSRDSNKDKKWVAFATVEGKMTDYCLSNSTFEDQIFRNTFWDKAQILQFGHARNDILCERDTERLYAVREKVYSTFHLDKWIKAEKNARLRKIDEWCLHKKLYPDQAPDPMCPWSDVDFSDENAVLELKRRELEACEDLKICLYAPTFRDDGDMRPYQIDYQKLRESLATRFGGTWVIFIRFHWRLLKKTKNKKFEAGVINASKYSDIQELLTCADVGITDYSSWICDYLLTKRPGFLFATDLQEYTERDRDFCYPLNTLPYPLALNNEELMECILNFDDTRFEEKCDLFLKDKGCIDDGHASKRIVNAIQKIIDTGNSGNLNKE